MTRSDAATQREMTRRIVRAWHDATAADLESGLSWYSRAGDLADALAAGTDLSREQTAGCIAALSPRCGWSANVGGATAMVQAHAVGATTAPRCAGTTRNRDKAWRILQHSGDPLDILGGPKVRAFYRNICGDTDAVTVDVWAARCAEGCDNDNAPAGKRYRMIADAYRRAASLVGVTPRDCQAAVWTYFRRTHATALYDLNTTNEVTR